MNEIEKQKIEKQKLEIWRLQGEVDRLTRIINSYFLQYGTVRDQQRVIDKAKAEVAREIFEEIEKIIIKHLNDAIKSKSVTAELQIDYIELDISELKKKYTEGESNG